MWGLPGKLARGSARLLFTILCVAVAAYAFTYLFREFRTGDPFAARFAISGWDIPAHFFGAGLALLLAPLQLSSRLRRQLPRLHRLGGWLYVAAVLIGSVSGLLLAPHAQGGAASGTGFAVLAILWPCVTVYGVSRAMAGDLARHRRWMCRSAALTFSAVTLRAMLGLGAGVMQLPFLAVYIAAAWLSWPISLAVCELLLRWPAMRSRRRARNAARRDASVTERHRTSLNPGRRAALSPPHPASGAGGSRWASRPPGA